MIPLRLTIKGIYSYQQQQTINFIDLTSARLFGIFGPVGSGKSTILEAISFALFGETERLNLRDNRSYNMMNLKSNELFIDFIFTNSKDGDEYRFVVNGKRNKKHFEKTSALERSAYHKINGEWLPIEPGSINEIIGLSYENFRRTIIIPQGKFQEFMQLRDTDRTRMLKEIFALGKYEFYYNVVALEKKNDEEKNKLSGQLQQLAETSPERIAVEEKQLKEMEATATQLKQSLQQKQRAEAELQKLQELFAQTATQKQRLAELETETADWQKKAARIKDYEFCLLEFKDLLARRRENHGRLKKSDLELQQKRKQFDRIKVQLDATEKEFGKTKDEFDNREKLKKESEELEEISRIRELQKQAEELNKQIGKVNDWQQKSNLRLQALKEKSTMLAAGLKTKKKAMPDANKLMAVKDWFTNKKATEVSIVKLEQTRQQLLAGSERLQAEKNRSVARELVDLLAESPAVKSAQELISELERLKNQIEKQKNKTGQEIEQLVVQEKLEEFAENLAEGQPCPLCGSEAHPQILDSKHVSRHLQFTRKQSAEFDHKLGACSETLKRLTGISTEIATQKKLLEGNGSELISENEKLENHLKKFTWSDYRADNENSVTAALTRSHKLRQEIVEMENEAEQLQKNLEDETEQKEKTQAELIALNNRKTELTAASRTLLKQLKLLKFDSYQDWTNQRLLDEARELHHRTDQIEKQYRESETRLVELRKTRNTLLGTIESAEKAHHELQRSFADIEQKVADKIENSRFVNLAEIEAILASDPEVEKEKKAIERFRQELHTARTRYDEFALKTTDKSYSRPEHQQLLAELEHKRAEIEESGEKIGKQKSTIQRLQEALATREKLEKKFESLKLRGEDINTLKQLFKGSGFVNYVSTVYLQNLCRAANERFYQLTRKQLRLELSENNNFQVRDFLNEGRLRSVKTLSGGQTFQAALSLALSLAESIQVFNKSEQNFFFLDEGFGALDKESLQIVFDTLKSLQKENRIIGVISHVEEMQQEIDTYLTIVNDEESGSFIKSSWESFG